MFATLVQIRLHNDERDAIDAYRRQQQDPPTRAKAIRDLIRRALIDSSKEAAAA